jgi:hypothetical protein
VQGYCTVTLLSKLRGAAAETVQGSKDICIQELCKHDHLSKDSAAAQHMQFVAALPCLAVLLLLLLLLPLMDRQLSEETAAYQRLTPDTPLFRKHVQMPINTGGAVEQSGHPHHTSTTASCS